MRVWSGWSWVCDGVRSGGFDTLVRTWAEEDCDGVTGVEWADTRPVCEGVEWADMRPVCDGV